jgi:hypothetical protein
MPSTIPSPSGADIAAQQAVYGVVFDNTNYLSQGQVVAPYLEYTINTFYLWKQGTLQLPIANIPTNPNQQTSNVDSTVDTAASETDLQLPAGVIGGPQTQCQAPYTSRQASVTVQTSAPYGKKIVVISARRIGAQPVLPDPTPSNDNQTLDTVVINEQNPIIMPDMKTRIFITRAQYTYNLTTPLWVPDGMLSIPNSMADGNTRVPGYNIPSTQFTKGLI